MPPDPFRDRLEAMTETDYWRELVLNGTHMVRVPGSTLPDLPGEVTPETYVAALSLCQGIRRQPREVYERLVAHGLPEDACVKLAVLLCGRIQPKDATAPIGVALMSGVALLMVVFDVSKFWTAVVLAMLALLAGADWLRARREPDPPLFSGGGGGGGSGIANASRAPKGSAPGRETRPELHVAEVV
jgi:hypothetical protein